MHNTKLLLLLIQYKKHSSRRQGVEVESQALLNMALSSNTFPAVGTVLSGSQSKRIRK